MFPRSPRIWSPRSIEGGRLMNLPERRVVENLDEAIRRSILRLEQEQLHVSMLQVGGDQHSSAKAALEERTAAVGRLKAYRSKFPLD
jgi:hypothetical protein